MTGQFELFALMDAPKFKTCDGDTFGVHISRLSRGGWGNKQIPYSQHPHDRLTTVDAAECIYRATYIFAMMPFVDQ